MTAQIKMTRKEAEVQMACFRQTFSSVRLLNEKTVLQAPRTHSKRTELECRVLHEKRQLTTLDVTPQRAEQIFARYIEVDGEPCVLELVQDLQQDTPEAVVQRRQMLTQTGSMGEKLYRDALTGLYNRRYYEDALKNRSMEAGVAVLDMDGFKACNETYGHQAGDKMLEATVTVGNTSDTVQFVYSIPITKGVGNQKHVTIIAGDNKYFTLRDKGQSCILKAVARMGSDEITTGLAYKWYNQVNGAWSVLSGKTIQTLTVTNDMVDTTGVFKAEVYQGGKLIGQDTQSVMDASDPFDLILNPTPEDETIRESGDTVVYKPILVKRGSTTKYKDMTFYFVFMDSAGVVLNPSTSGTAATSGTCTWDMCQQAGGNVAWTITTKE